MATISEDARRIMQLASQEADRLDDAEIDGGHMLLAILKSGRGIGHDIAKRFRLDLRQIRLARERLEGERLPAPFPAGREGAANFLMLMTAKNEDGSFRFLLPPGISPELAQAVIDATEPANAPPDCTCATANLMTRGCTCGAMRP
jgi:ATP-dependent Clp protease ATP-binding subunit ClpA